MFLSHCVGTAFGVFCVAFLLTFHSPISKGSFCFPRINISEHTNEGAHRPTGTQVFTADQHQR